MPDNLFPEIPIWPGSSSFSSSLNPTPFGFFDNEPSFATESDAFAIWATGRLGYPIVDIELASEQFYACLEEATLEYGAQVNQFNIRDNMLIAQGASTSSDLTQKNITNTLGRVIQLAEQYGVDTLSGGNITLRKGFIQTTSGEQNYDLQSLWSDIQESGSRMEIKRIFHNEPPASTRFYDPFVESGFSRMNVMNEFGWSGMSTAVQYTLFPVYEDILRIQAIEFSDMIRRSGYGFEIHNNVLRLFPIPRHSFKLWFEYILKDDRNLSAGVGSVSGSTDVLQDGVQSDYSNIQYNLIQYNTINDVGKQWIRRFGLACVKMTLGHIRGKYGSIPTTDGEVSLDGDTLRNEAATEQEILITQLRENLDEISRRTQMVRKQEEDQALLEQLNKIPLPIFVG